MASRPDIEAGRAFVRLYTKRTDLEKGLGKAEARLRAFGAAATQVGRTVAIAGGIILAAFAFSAREFATFQDKMLAVKAVTGATRDEFAKLTEQARELGRTTSYTAAQIGDIQLSLGRAGFKTPEIIAATPGVMNLSRATGTDTAESADIASGTLRAFRLEADQMTRVADVLTATANNSAQTLTDLGEAMKMAAPIADEYGMSLEETSKAVGILANLQIKGTMAGTALRQIMLQLSDPAIQKKLRALGVETLTTSGELRGVAEILGDVGKAMQGMSGGERLALGKDLFGQRAAAAGLKLARTDAKALSDAIDNAAGSAARLADEMDSGLGGAGRRLMSAFEGVKLSLGDAISAPLSALTDKVGNFLNGLTEWIDRNRDLAVSIAAIAAGVTGIGGTILGLGLAANGAAAGVLALANAVKMARMAFAFLMLNPYALILAGIAAAVVAVGAAAYQASAYTAQLSDSMRKTRERGDELRSQQMDQLDRLAALAEQEGLTSDQMDEAAGIIDKLQLAYGDLGIALDRATGKLTGVAEAQAKVNKLMREAALRQVQAELAELSRNMSELNKEQGSGWNQFWAAAGGLFSGGPNDALAARDKDYVERQKGLLDQYQALLARKKALEAGNQAAITGGSPAAGAATPGGAVVPVPAPPKSSDWSEKTKGLTTFSWRDLQDAMAEDDQETQRRRRDAAYETARLEIELARKGLQQKLALIELERRKRLEDLQEQGALDPEMRRDVERQFAIRAEMARQAESGSQVAANYAAPSALIRGTAAEYNARINQEGRDRAAQLAARQLAAANRQADLAADGLIEQKEANKHLVELVRNKPDVIGAPL